MATLIAVEANSRTPDSVVLGLSNNGAADLAPLEIPKAALLAQLLPGPLYELISRTADLSVFNVNSVDPRDNVIRFTEIAGGQDSVIVPPITTLVLRFSATGLEYSIYNVGGGGGTASGLMVEMRATHSNER